MLNIVIAIISALLILTIFIVFYLQKKNVKPNPKPPKPEPPKPTPPKPTPPKPTPPKPTPPKPEPTPEKTKYYSCVNFKCIKDVKGVDSLERCSIQCKKYQDCPVVESIKNSNVLYNYCMPSVLYNDTELTVSFNINNKVNNEYILGINICNIDNQLVGNLEEKACYLSDNSNRCDNYKFLFYNDNDEYIFSLYPLTELVNSILAPGNGLNCIFTFYLKDVNTKNILAVGKKQISVTNTSIQGKQSIFNV